MNLPGASPASRRRLPWCPWVLGLGLAVGVRLAAQEGPASPQRYPSSDNPGGFMPIRPLVICFPPTPPPLDRAVSRAALPMTARMTPPAELAAYVNEPFYAPLSTWLLEHELTATLRERIEALRAAKVNALTDLRATLEQVRDSDPPTRRHALEALAKQQTPKLAVLERDAEQIRADLATSDYDWRALRQWALGERGRRADSPMEIAATMRAYAYYQAELAPAQRRLLREISLELAMAGEDTAAATAAQPYLFFSPEPARVLLPDEMPAALAAKVAAYQTKKSALKKELYDAVFKEDNTALAFMRNRALRSLAEKQASRLAELETLAEEIRRGLAELPSATRPVMERSPLPPVLAERLNAAVRTGATLQKDTMKKIDAVRAQVKDGSIQISYSLETSGMKFVVVPRAPRTSSTAEARSQLEKIKPRVREIEAQMTEIADDFGRRYADLVNESNAIREAAAVALGNADARAVNAALTAARRVAALKESEDAYREYRLAVFEPGLSPEQRRLLFGGALEKLDLPLPRGEFQPVQRAAGW